MRSLFLSGILIVTATAWGQELKQNEFSVSLGYMAEGEAYAAEFDEYYSVGETILIRGEFNHYLSSMNDRFGLGAYYTLGFPYYSYLYEEVTMHELGMILKARFNASDQLQIKPGIYVGFRAYMGDDSYAGDSPGTGLGVNASVAFQYQLEKVKPFIDLGILTQPAGGNDLTVFTFGPVLQISVGITL